MAEARPRWESPLTRKLETFVTLSETEREFLAGLESDPRRVAPDSDVAERGEPYDGSAVLLSGWAIEHKTFHDGRRQVVDFLLPGTFIGLYANVCDVADSTVTTLTDATLSRFPSELVVEAFARFPHLASAIAWSTAREAAILSERIASLGRRSAYERLAHLLLELWARLRVRGLDRGDSFAMPVTQAVVADVLGLSVVHLNRSYRRLRRDGYITYDTRSVRILDRAGLERAAGFDDDYLLHRDMSRRLRETLARLSPHGSSLTRV